MEHLFQKSTCSIFHTIFKYMIFQRRQKALLWSKGLYTKTLQTADIFDSGDKVTVIDSEPHMFCRHKTNIVLASLPIHVHIDYLAVTVHTHSKTIIFISFFSSYL